MSVNAATRIPQGLRELNELITPNLYAGPGIGGTTPSSASITFGYDDAGRVSAFTDADGAHTVAYDHDSNRTRLDGVTSTYNPDDSMRTQNMILAACCWRASRWPTR